MIWILLAILIFVILVGFMYLTTRTELRRRGGPREGERTKVFPEDGPEPPPPGPWTISGGLGGDS